MEWFRFYSEALHDRKLGRVCRISGQDKARVLGAWTVILCLASESPERGRLLIAEDMPLTQDEILDEMGLDGDGVEILEAMEAVGMIEVDQSCGCGCYQVAAWGKRQFEEADNSTERVRRFRERQRQEAGQNQDDESGGPVPEPVDPPDNGGEKDESHLLHETLQKQDGNVTETLLKRYRNVSETPPESESETESDPESEKDSDSIAHAREAKRILKDFADQGLKLPAEAADRVMPGMVLALGRHPPADVIEAMEISFEKSSGDVWDYARAILKRWENSGKPPPKQYQNGGFIDGTQKNRPSNRGGYPKAAGPIDQRRAEAELAAL